MSPRDPNLPNDPGNGGNAEPPTAQKPAQPSGPSNGQPTDGKLLRLLRRGDAAAFGPLFARHGAKLWRLARFLTHDDETAEQVLVAALRSALDELTFAREVVPLESWLYGQVVRQAWLAGARRQPESTPQRPGGSGRSEQGDRSGQSGRPPARPTNPLTYGPDDRLEPPAEDWGIRLDGEVLHDQLRIVLQRSAPSLPPDLRAAWALVDVEKLSYALAGEALDLAPATVRGRVHLARLLLRQALTRHVQGAAALEAAGPSS